jgi:hypothetical protein
LAGRTIDPVTQWFKVRAPILALLVTLLGIMLSMYGRITSLEQQQRDMLTQQQMIWQAVENIETRITVVR